MVRSRVSSIAVGLTLVLCPAAQANWLTHFVESDYFALSNHKGPKNHSMGMFVPDDVPAGAEICIGFQNTSSKANKGKISGVIEIFRGVESLGRGNVSGNVRDNFLLECLITSAPLQIGDIVIGDVTMKKLAKMKAGEVFVTAIVLFPDLAASRAAGRAPRPWKARQHDWRELGLATGN